MSDLGFSLGRFSREKPEQDERSQPSSWLFEALSQPAKFRPDVRFGGPALEADPQDNPPPPVPEPEAPDPLTEAFARGYAKGSRQASEDAAQRAAADAAARERLSLSFARIDDRLEEELRLRLRDTVAALCEAAIAPLALDPAALGRRIEVAVSMLSRADDDRVVHLNPRDFELVSPRLHSEWKIRPDRTLERGTVRIETGSGGVEDGPATWRRAIAEALQQC
ncbi:flagellar assembly protein FliH [Novosphingobium sp. PhB165]|uniref:FliH/SctL family protein n=1 Tax=Novosphingobium sp. PhB165 TaxID=2485105 RepID=UPI0010492E48|nr:FliH/SctL family protein [Novosphingobium sp. PhB165]TCM18862.1 flagellar assembly protein FliH [Novosphingobium sp. PhB165]